MTRRERSGHSLAAFAILTGPIVDFLGLLAPTRTLQELRRR